MARASNELHRLVDRHEDAGHAGEHLATKNGCDKNRCTLRARLTVTRVLFGQLVHTEDGDDVLQLLVALEDLLHPTGHGVVPVTDDLGSEDVRLKSTPAGPPPVGCPIASDPTGELGRVPSRWVKVVNGAGSA